MSRVSRLAILGAHIGDLGAHARDFRLLLATQIRDLGREPRVETRDLGREPRVEGGNLRPHLGEPGRELIGRDVIAALRGQTDRIRDGVGLGRRELGVGQRAGDGVRVEHAVPIIAEDTFTKAGARDRGPRKGGLWPRTPRPRPARLKV